MQVADALDPLGSDRRPSIVEAQFWGKAAFLGTTTIR
jgi:hypothetical protein